MVTQDKQRVEKGIKDTTKAPPTQRREAQAGDAADAREARGDHANRWCRRRHADARPATETDLRHGPAPVDNEMAEADVTEEQLQESNEPEFEQAVEAKKTAEAHSTEAPAAYREAEAETLGATRRPPRATRRRSSPGCTAAGWRASTRSRPARRRAKSKDEAKRLEVATKIDSIFAKTKTDVTKILDGIEAKMTPIFERGEKQARATFEATCRPG